LRLVGGKTPSLGRLEIRRRNGRWGTICRRGFGAVDASVACRQLGEGMNGTVLRSGAFGPGSGAIWLSQVACTGNETRLEDCRSRGWGHAPKCSHAMDVAIRCSSTKQVAITVRLLNGSDTSSGRLEVWHNGTWGTVCKTGFNATDASVACGQMRLGKNGVVAASRSGPAFGPGKGTIWLSQVNCNGRETRIEECWNRGWGTAPNCTHAMDVAVACAPGNARHSPMFYVAQYVTARLVNGSSASSGRLEVWRGGIWGTVCSTEFNATDASVACRQMGFARNGTIVASRSGPAFGPGKGTIWLSQVNCTGRETRIEECWNRGWGTAPNCTHAMDVAIRCALITTGRL
ncbi:hypothetical protein CHLNCDRAFT_22917, partial [Chlorella variabilis]